LEFLEFKLTDSSKINEELRLANEELEKVHYERIETLKIEHDTAISEE